MNKPQENGRAKRWLGDITPPRKVIDRFPQQIELFPREVDIEKVEKYIGSADRERRDKQIREFIINPYSL